MNPTPNLQVIKRNVQVATIHPVEKLILVDLPREVNSVKRRDKSDLPDYLQPLIERASSKLTGSERQSLANLVSEFEDIFVGPDGKFGQTNLVEHEIDTGTAKPIKLPPRRLPIYMREVAEQEINKIL